MNVMINAVAVVHLAQSPVKRHALILSAVKLHLRVITRKKSALVLSSGMVLSTMERKKDDSVVILVHRVLKNVKMNVNTNSVLTFVGSNVMFNLVWNHVKRS